MSTSLALLRRYEYPTCTLEILAPRAVKGFRWRRLFPPQHQFRLRLADPTSIAETLVEGDRDRLTVLGRMVAEAVEAFVRHSVPSLVEETTATATLGHHQLPLDLGEERSTFEVGSIQLFDLANAIEAYRRDDAVRRGKVGGLVGISVLVLAVAGAGGAWWFWQQRSLAPETVVTPPEVSSPPEAAPPDESLSEPPEIPAQPTPSEDPLASLDPLPPPPPVETPPESEASQDVEIELSRGDLPETPPSPPTPEAPEPQTPATETAETPTSEETPAPQLPQLPTLEAETESPARDEPPIRRQLADLPSLESRVPEISSAPIDNSQSVVAANPDRPASSGIVQVAQVRDYFQQRWEPPASLEGILEYRLFIKADGTLERIVPIGEAAGVYIDQTQMPLLGEPFVAPLQRSQNSVIRLVLGADGTVKAFREAS